MRKEKISRTELQAAAEDINKVLTPEPLLDLKKDSEELQKDVEELFPNIMKGDALSEETWVTLTALGWKDIEEPKAEEQKTEMLIEKPKKAKKKKKRISRMESIAIVLKQKPVDSSKMAALANVEYIKKGGISNEKASASFWGFAKPILKALNVISFEDGKVILQK